MFLHDFQSYTMADNNSVVQRVMFYELVKNSLWLSKVHNKKRNRFLLDITRKFSYTKDEKTKEGRSTIYLKLTATKALVDQLSLAYQFTKNIQDNQGAELYNKCCLISEIC